MFPGHTLLVPKAHWRLLSDLPAAQAAEFLTTAQRLERAVEDGLGAAGSMILVNNVVSQSVPHLHLHVIPRNPKDGLRFWLGPRHPYTAEGTGFAVTLHAGDGVVLVFFADGGPGISDPDSALQRGSSGAGSTGLGLDIARRVAESTGGGLKIDRSALGGAQVQMWLRTGAPLSRRTGRGGRRRLISH